MGLDAVVIRGRGDGQEVHSDAHQVREFLVEVAREVRVQADALIRVALGLSELVTHEPCAQQQQPLASQLLRVGLDVFLDDDLAEVTAVRQVDQQHLVAFVAEQIVREFLEVQADGVEMVGPIHVGADMVGQGGDGRVEGLAGLGDHRVLPHLQRRFTGISAVFGVQDVGKMHEQRCSPLL